MKKTLKKSLSWLLVLATLFSLCAAMSVGISAAPISLGKAGPNIDSSFDPATGTLTLFGSGPMTDFVADGSKALYTTMANDNRPWKDFTRDIKKVELVGDITTIGNAAFYNLKFLTSCTLPATLKIIGEWSFARTSMTSVIIPATTERVKHFAFWQSSLTGDGVKNSICLGPTVIENDYGAATTGSGAVSGANSSTNEALVGDLMPGSQMIEATGDMPVGIEWRYSPLDKKLTLSYTGAGTAQMADMAAFGSAPWNSIASEIRTVEVGKGIGNIGAYAFANFTSLTSVTLGKDVAEIGRNAFYGCTALTHLELPDKTTKIGSGAFGGRSSYITVKTTYTKASLDPTNECRSDYYITWNYGSTVLGGNAPAAPDKSGTLSNGVTWAFSNGKLTLTAPSANLVIPDFTSYADTPWYKNDLTNSITSIEIGANITSIGKYAFSFLPNLTNVTFGSNVQIIHQYAFWLDTALNNLTFPQSVLLVDSNAFTGCNSLTSATKLNANMNVQDTNTELKNALSNPANPGTGTQTPTTAGTIAGTNVTWVYDQYNKRLTIDGYGEIPPYVSAASTPWSTYASQITSVKIGNNITKIGKAAFKDMTALNTVDLGTGLQIIGEQAFAYDSALTYIAIPASVTKVEMFAFYYSGLVSATSGNASMTIEAGNTELNNALGTQSSNPSNPYSGTIAGTSLTWSYSSTNNMLMINGSGVIPNYNNYTETPWAKAALTGQVKKIYIGSDVTAIGDNAFANMMLLDQVSVGRSVQRIGKSAFFNARSLTTIALGASVTLVDSNAFTNSGLTSASKENANMQILDPNTELKTALNKQPSGGSGNPPTQGVDSEGVFGPNNMLKWQYTASDYTLIIVALDGAVNVSIPDYSSANTPNWSHLRNSIKTILLGRNIASIGDYAFANMPYLSSIILGNDVTTIGSYAFYNDTGLTEVTFPKSVATIEPNAFTGCSALTSATKQNAAMQVYTPNAELNRALGNPSGSQTPSNPNPSTPGAGSQIIQYIEGTSLIWTYDTTTGALTITGNGAIPNYTMTKKAPWSTYALSITSITVQTGVTEIGDRAFADLARVVDVYLANTITKIGAEAFFGCASLRSVVLPSALFTLGNGAFGSCTALTEITIPNGVTVIGENTFRDCSALESVQLPANLTQIGTEAFANCTKLKSIELPTMLQTVGVRAFYGDYSLETVIFRASNTFVLESAFDNCTAIQKAVFEMTAPNVVSTGNDTLLRKLMKRYEAGAGWSSDRATGTLTITATGEITNSAAWREELQYASTLVFSQGVTGIGANLLKDNRNVTRVQMADSVTTIGASAFENCASLESISFSNALHTMGARAFYGCNALTSIRLPNSLKVIPESAFADCSTLKSVAMGNELMMIGANAFAKCSALDNVTLPMSLRSIAAGAFNDCRALTKLEMYGGNLNQLAANTFDNCVLLSMVDFHGTRAEWDALTAVADPELKAANVTYYVKLTVHHVYKGGPKDGQTVATSDVLSGKKDDVLTITAKTNVEHYEADEFDATFTLGADNSEITITYSPKTYTLKIECVDAKTGTLLGKLPDQKVKYGDAFTASAGAIEGYTAEDATISIESMTGDMTYTVKYNKNVYTYTVEYFNTKTQKVFGSKDYQAEHGTAITAETPELTGYTLVSGSYKIDKLTKEGEKITVKYEPSQKMLTIVYVDTEGNKLSEDVTVSVYYGAEVMIASPMITGKVADQEIVSLEAYNGEDKITVTYDWRYYTVTIRFLEKDSYGYQIRPDYVKSVKHGDPFTFAMDDSYNEAAYVTDKSAVTYAAVTADITETVTYSPKPLKLTIEYVKADGKKIGTVEQTVYAGKSYTVEPHEFKKYLQTEQPVTGTMGVEDDTITITLEKDPNAGSVGRVLLVIFIILLVLGTGGALFYFLYLKKKPY